MGFLSPVPPKAEKHLFCKSVTAWVAVSGASCGEGA